MKTKSPKRAIPILAMAIVLTVLSLACTPVTSILMPTSTPTPTFTPTPTSTPTPTPTPPQIETSAGTMTVAAVELADSFPPGCSSGPTCNRAKEGYRILVVWLERADGGSIREVADQLFGETLTHLTGDGEICVTDVDDNTSSLAITHVDDDDNRFALVFAVRDTAQGFTLAWLDNPPIELGK